MTYPEALLQEQFASGTSNPVEIVLGGITTRLLNTTIRNDDTTNIVLDITTGIVTLGAGTYTIEFDAIGHELTGPYQNQLIDVDNNNAVLAVGFAQHTPITGYAVQSKQSSPGRSGQIVVAAGTTKRVALVTWYGGTATGVSVNLGQDVGSGQPNVSGRTRIIKEA